MNQFVTIDFETYYTDKANGGYSLSYMTAEEYIRDPRFEVVGFALKFGDAPSQWFTGDDAYLRGVLASVDWSDVTAVGHNMSEFDSLILTEYYGIRPPRYACTLQMARALHGSKDSGGKNLSNSLGAVAKMYGLPPKGDEVVRAINKRRLDFRPDELAAYGVYCCTDADLCWQLFKLFVPQFPRVELQLMSLSTRMFAEPKLMVDAPLAKTLLADMIVQKAERLSGVGDMLGIPYDAPDRIAQVQKLLRKDEVMAGLLRDQFGVEPPRKFSPTRANPDGTPLSVYAFAKTDEGMTELLEHEDEDVQILATARLGVKSTLAESRTERFVGIGERGMLPVALVYGKVHTHRLAGGQKMNMQNLSGARAPTKRTPKHALVAVPQGFERLAQLSDKQLLAVSGNVYELKNVHVAGLRDCVVAPKGKKLVVVDSSQIELRVCHLLAGQMDTIAELRAGIDVYSSFASTLYGRPVSKADYKERQHGKVGMLQLQYQAGGGSFRNAARIMGGVYLTEDEAYGTVDTYRSRFTEVRGFWRKCKLAIERMARGEISYIDQWGLCRVEAGRISMPGTLPLVYHNLRQEMWENMRGEPELQWVYDDKEKRHAKKVYGGSVTENLCQWIARRVVFEQMLEIERAWGDRFRGNGVALTVHDEVVVVVDEDRAEECLAYCQAVMSTPPKWWPELPVACEGGIADRYADAK